MSSRLISQFKKMKSWQILLSSILLSEAVSTPIVTLMSVILRGRVERDFLITSAVTAMFAAGFVTSLLELFMSEIRRSEAELDKRAQRLAEANRELDEARRSAEEASRVKSEFLTTMSHELRTPLHAINGYVVLALSGTSGDLSDTLRQNLERTLVNGQHLLGLIDGILDLSKIEAGTMEFLKRPFAVREWLDETVAPFREQAAEKGLAFEVVLDETLPPTLMSDANRLRQIASNLLANAIKFTDEGRVAIEVAAAEGEHWTLTVTDTGVGIPPQAQVYIFDEFRQVDGSFEREHGGTGLGLAIVRRLALLMGGDVTVGSEVGTGSTFTVRLPLEIA
jgi:signal transduction histidine kinase